jgi:hypothetical protein
LGRLGMEVVVGPCLVFGLLNFRASFGLLCQSFLLVRSGRAWISVARA